MATQTKATTATKATKATTSPKAGAKPRAAKATDKPAAAAKAAKPAAKARKPAAPGASKDGGSITPEQRRYYVEVAAYYIAERRGFYGGGELSDWVQAETEIDRLLSAGILRP